MASVPCEFPCSQAPPGNALPRGSASPDLNNRSNRFSQCGNAAPNIGGRLYSKAQPNPIVAWGLSFPRIAVAPGHINHAGIHCTSKQLTFCTCIDVLWQLEPDI